MRIQIFKTMIITALIMGSFLISTNPAKADVITITPGSTISIQAGGFSTVTCSKSTEQSIVGCYCKDHGELIGTILNPDGTTKEITIATFYMRYDQCKEALQRNRKCN